MAFTVAAFHGDSLIGAVTVRLERQQDGTAKLCLITLGVLAAYRGGGIGMSYTTIVNVYLIRRFLHNAAAHLLQCVVLPVKHSSGILNLSRLILRRVPNRGLAFLPACTHSPCLSK